MTRVVWKYDLHNGHNSISLPKGAQILSVGEQYGHIKMWALCDPYIHSEGRDVRVVATGERFEPLLFTRFLGTVSIGEYIWHVFEESRDGIG